MRNSVARRLIERLDRCLEDDTEKGQSDTQMDINNPNSARDFSIAIRMDKKFPGGNRLNQELERQSPNMFPPGLLYPRPPAPLPKPELPVIPQLGVSKGVVG